MPVSSMCVPTIQVLGCRLTGQACRPHTYGTAPPLISWDQKRLLRLSHLVLIPLVIPLILHRIKLCFIQHYTTLHWMLLHFTTPNCTSLFRTALSYPTYPILSYPILSYHTLPILSYPTYTTLHCHALTIWMPSRLTVQGVRRVRK